MPKLTLSLFAIVTHFIKLLIITMVYPEHVIAIDEILNGAEELVTYNECCIYRVPFHLRELNEDAYTPKVVSIGPFHHNTHPRLRNMERYKVSYCKYFLQERTRTTSDTWIDYIESVEPQIRRCYSETLPFSKEELVNIIFVDSGFILELFCRYYSQSWSDGEGAKERFCTFQRTNRVLDRVKHELRRMKLKTKQALSCHSENRSKPNTATNLLSATELSEVGVKFEVNNNENMCLLDLKFKKPVLKIPQLKVQDSTEMLFRNMVALEQCHYHMHRCELSG
ncbi:hypothetical protein Fmac_000792 [Flemingia macrophylla]|uniref:Uncharacterized protein n=1 Tax=Flemingia macrophylla TaxID=520843 RepID=A0ABD1NF89_9FABA